MSTRIKFCGLVRAADVDTAVALGVDAIGFVFYPPSPRCLSPQEARALRERLPGHVQAVGLFVNAATEAVRAIDRQVGLDIVQFHGDEDPAVCEAAARPYWKAVRMSAQTDLLESGKRFASAACLLLDSLSEGYGGSGQSFDWSWIPGGLAKPVVLSGGLDEHTVSSGIARVAPFAVDVSSGIQGSNPREKDVSRMERFVAAVRAADGNLR